MNGAWLALHGKDQATVDGGCMFGLYSADGVNRIGLEGNVADGSLLWDNNDLGGSTIVAKNFDNYGGYIKFASGEIRQWGVEIKAPNQTQTITFPISFTTRQFLIIQPSSSSYTSYDFQVAIKAEIDNLISNDYIVKTNYPDGNVSVNWFAIGY